MNKYKGKIRYKIKRAGLFLICAYGCFLYAKEISYFPAVVEQSFQAAAQIEVYRTQEGRKVSLGSGSGFFVQDSKTFVTNAHVIPLLLMDFDLLEDLNSIRIKKDGQFYRVKSIRNISIFHDLSVLEVEAYTGPFLKLGKHNVDETVYTMGFVRREFYKFQTQTAFYREEYPFYDLFPSFTDYKGLQGISGGPVVNSQGDLVGIVSQARPWNIGVVKSEFLKNLLEKPPFEGKMNELVKQQVRAVVHSANQGDKLAQQVLGEFFLHDAIAWVSYIPLSFFERIESIVSEPEEFYLQQALKWTKKAALQDYPRASFNVGALYFNNKLNISEELANKEAFYWIRESALLGYPYAEFVLGFLIYKEGIGVAPSKRKTFEWVLKAALSGHPRAGFEVGLMHLDEDYVEPSERKAMEWILKAALRGNTLAQFTSGLMSYMGAGTEQNFTKAFEYFHIAAEMADHSPSQFIVGAMYGRGIGVEHDKALSNHWLVESMLEGRFGVFADLMGGLSEINPGKRDVVDFPFVQIVMSNPLQFEEEDFELRDVARIVRLMENTHSSF